MTDSYELPKKIEHYIATLSRLCARDGRRSLQEILVNAQTRVVEAWTTDNWNGGTYGHALFLTVPESLFLAVFRKRNELQDEIERDINQINSVQNEHLAEVFLEKEATEDGDWRRESGLLIATSRTVAPEAAKRIWFDDEGFRLFLSHKSEVKTQAAAVKAQLGVLGVSAFVTHEDILPTRDWQEEIENALHSMDAFVAVMTEGFHDSDWTDQEVGFALARGVPVIALRVGRDPYGFLGKFQALSSGWDGAAEGIVKLLIRHDRMFSAYVRAMRNCASFDNGNRLSRILPSIEKLTSQQIDELVAAYNENSQVRESFGFNGTKPTTTWGPGLVHHLHRLGTRQFTMDRMNHLTQVAARRQLASFFPVTNAVNG